MFFKSESEILEIAKKCGFKLPKQNKNFEGINIANLNVNQSAKIIGYLPHMEFKQKKRLLELGLVCGNKVKLINKSMLGNGALFEVNGFMLGLRDHLAKNILCEVINDK